MEELSNAARTFNVNFTDDPEAIVLDEFLAHAALEAGDGQADADEDAVQLMTRTGISSGVSCRHGAGLVSASTFS